MQMGSMVRQIQASSSGGSSALRWMGTFLCAISPSRWAGHGCRPLEGHTAYQDLPWLSVLSSGVMDMPCDVAPCVLLVRAETRQLSTATAGCNLIVPGSTIMHDGKSRSWLLRPAAAAACVALQNGDEMRQAISSKLPAKIDIGPVYNVDPQRRMAYAGGLQHGS